MKVETNGTAEVAPYLSVIIPCRDGERYLAEAIAAILDQDCDDFEIVFVDNGSTDASAEIAAGFGRRVRVVVEPEPGIGKARNRGVLAARGRVLGFSDADDRWAPSRLPDQLRHLEALPANAISTGLQQ